MATKKPLVQNDGTLAEMSDSQTIPPLNLGTSTPSSSKYLKGDGTWDDLNHDTTLAGTGTTTDKLRVTPTRKKTKVIEEDFIVTAATNYNGFACSGINSGSFVAATGAINHPGVVSLRDSTTANGGYRIMSEVTAFLLNGGEKFTCTFKTMDARSTSQYRIGFQDSLTATQPTDGVWFEVLDNSVPLAKGVGKSNATPVYTATGYTLTINTWYTIECEFNNDATLVTFRLYDDSGSLLWTDTLSSGIPTATGRETGFGVVVTESTTDAAAAIINLDYISLEVNRTLIR